MGAYFDQFGGKVTKELKEKYSQSNNWVDGKFKNLEHTYMSIKPWDIPGLLYKQFTGTRYRQPTRPIPIPTFDKQSFLLKDNKVKYIWYGHSVLLLRIGSRTVLIDPMLGPDAAPITPVTSKRYSNNTLSLIDDFPDVDVMLISHDHYDHLDYNSIQKLKGKIKKYCVALGVKRHLIRWGVDPQLISEFDWWEDLRLGELKVTFTPSRHFSGRSLTDRSKALWGGWAMETTDHNIYFSGDGGYGSHFSEIGKRLGPFDFGFMECGQYNEKWRLIHMFPEESVQAAIDAKVKKAMPVHWAGFTLSTHTWQEPVEHFIKYAQAVDLPYFTPEVGVTNSIAEKFSYAWWEPFVYRK